MQKLWVRNERTPVYCDKCCKNTIPQVSSIYIQSPFSPSHHWPPLTPIIRSKIQIVARHPKIALIDAPWREDSESGLIFPIGPHLLPLFGFQNSQKIKILIFFVLKLINLFNDLTDYMLFLTTNTVVVSEKGSANFQKSYGTKTIIFHVNSMEILWRSSNLGVFHTSKAKRGG